MIKLGKPIWVLLYLIDQDEWWPSEAPHDIRFFPDVHTHCFNSEAEASKHRKTMKRPEAYHVHKTYLKEE